MVLSMKRHRITNPQASRQGVGDEIWRIFTPQAVGLQEGTRGLDGFDKGRRGVSLDKKSVFGLNNQDFPGKTDLSPFPWEHDP